MAQLAVVRVDSRLLSSRLDRELSSGSGQLAKGWIKVTNADHIMIIDDTIKGDAFMMQMNQHASPVPCIFKGVEEAAQSWKENQFGEEGRFIVLFQDVEPACRAYKAGFEFPLLQLGNIHSGPGRKVLESRLALSEVDAHMLNDLVKQGLVVEFRAALEKEMTPWQPTISKFFPSCV